MKWSSGVRGVEIRYNAAQTGNFRQRSARPGPTAGNGHQRITIFTDRTYFTILASDGLTYIPLPVIAKPTELGVEVQVKGGAAAIRELEAHQLKSIWEAPH